MVADNPRLKIPPPLDIYDAIQNLTEAKIIDATETEFEFMAEICAKYSIEPGTRVYFPKDHPSYLGGMRIYFPKCLVHYLEKK